MDHARFSKVVKYSFNFQIGKIKANKKSLVFQFFHALWISSCGLPAVNRLASGHQAPTGLVTWLRCEYEVSEVKSVVTNKIRIYRGNHSFHKKCLWDVNIGKYRYTIYHIPWNTWCITNLFSNLWSLGSQTKIRMSPCSGSSQAKEQKPNIGYDSQGHSQKLVWRVDLTTFRMMVGLPPLTKMPWHRRLARKNTVTLFTVSAEPVIHDMMIWNGVLMRQWNLVDGVWERGTLLH